MGYIAFDFEAHLAGGAGDDAEGGFRVVGVEVGHFDFHDLHHLGLVSLPTFDLVRLPWSRKRCPAAFLRRLPAGGFLVMKVNDLSL